MRTLRNGTETKQELENIEIKRVKSWKLEDERREKEFNARNKDKIVFEVWYGNYFKPSKTHIFGKAGCLCNQSTKRNITAQERSKVTCKKCLKIANELGLIDTDNRVKSKYIGVLKIPSTQKLNQVKYFKNQKR